MSHMNLTIKRMIRKYGESIPHRRQVKTINSDGEADISYVNEVPKRGQVNEITPFDEVFNPWGTKITADFIISFLPDVIIAREDRLQVRGYWCKVETDILHKTGSVADYLELFVRKEE